MKRSDAVLNLRQTLSVSLILAIAGTALLIWGLVALSINTRMLAEYDRSPGCVSGAADVDSSLSPCTLVTCTVSQKTETNGKGASRWLTLTSDTATFDHVRVPYNLFDRNYVGSIVQAQLWNGDVVRVFDYQGSARTEESQEYFRSDDFQGIGGGIFFIVCGALLALSQLKSYRSTIAKQRVEAIHEVADHAHILGDEAGINSSDMWK